MRLTTRTSLVAVAAVLGLFAAACGDDADTETASTDSSSNATESAAVETYEPVKISVAAVKGSTPGLPTFVAKKMGFFDEQGLDVELVNLVGPAITSALTSGSIQMTPQTITTAVQLKQKGVNARVIAGAFHAIPYAIVAPADSTIPVADGENWQDTIRALRGKTIGTSGAGGPLDYIMRSMFAAAGLNDTDFSPVQVQAGAPTIAAVQAGQVDAVVADIGTAMAAVAAGGKVVMDFTEQGPTETIDQVWSGFITTDDNIAKYEDFDKRLFAAMEKTAEWMKDPDNLAELHEIAVTESGVPESPTLDDTIKQTVALFEPVLPSSGVQATIDFLHETGQVEPTPVVAPQDIFYAGALR